MSLLNIFKSRDINEGVKQFRASGNAVLLDVRTRQEYNSGHIPGSLNIPLQEIGAVAQKISDKTTPIFVHCLSGGRSGRAEQLLGGMGYTNVKNIGGIGRYRGELEV